MLSSFISSSFVIQVKDYAERKGMPVEEIEKWLSPILSYDRD